MQRSVNGFDGQLSYFTRYDNVHFMPDPTGDLLLNGIASDVSRQAYTNGVQGDASYVVNSAQTLRVGFTVSAEKTWVDNTSIVEPCTACDGTDSGPPMSISDDNYKVGYLAGIYAQDEWRITNNLTVNYGARFDQMWQYTDANQLSPRVNFTYKPLENTTFHIGYARYFTPPVQVEAAPANIALFNGTTGAVRRRADPVLPERSHFFDAGIDQHIPLGCSTALKRDCAYLDLGIDGYYKMARDLIDNGQFGQALVLQAFNYLHGMTEGVELTAKYHNGGFDAYLNVAVSQEKATTPVSNQFLFDNTTPQPDLGGLTELQYLNSHWIFTDHNQFVTGSAGAVLSILRPRADAGRIVVELDMRHDADRRHDLRLGPAQWRRQHFERAALRAVQCRHQARLLDAGQQAGDPALRRRQCRRRDLSDPKRHRHRRVRVAIRPAPGLLLRHFQEVVSREMSPNAGRHSCDASLLSLSPRWRLKAAMSACPSRDWSGQGRRSPTWNCGPARSWVAAALNAIAIPRRINVADQPILAIRQTSSLAARSPMPHFHRDVDKVRNRLSSD